MLVVASSGAPAPAELAPLLPPGKMHLFAGEGGHVVQRGPMGGEGSTAMR